MKLTRLVTGLLSLGVIASANTITFQEASLSNGTQVTNQYSGLGITVQNAYFYVDGRDTFDQQGISIFNQGSAIVTFTSLASSLSIDYWVISGHTGTYSVFNGSHTLLDSFLVSATGGDSLGAHSFSGSNIATLEFSSDGGYIQVSTLRVNQTSTPEPATGMLLGSGLLAAGFFRRRQLR